MQSRLQLDSENPAFRVQLLCLLAAGILEYLFIVGQTCFNWVFYYCAETFLAVPARVFLGTALVQEQTVQAKRQLLLCAGMALWFVLVQALRKAAGMNPQSGVLFLGVWLMSLPFAAVTRDGEKQVGLRCIAWIFIAASLTLVFYTGLLVLNLIPASLSPYIKWDGARLLVLSHPNICACLFMIGIGLCLGFFFRCRRKGLKVLLLLAAAAQFICQILTHCRTSVLLTCALMGGIAFFAIGKGRWKRIAAGMAAALVLTCALFLASSALYEAHNARLITQLSQQSQQAAEASDAAAPPKVNAAGQLQGVSGQGTLKNDLRTLNGRTRIWSAAFLALQETPSIVVWGTDSVSPTLSYYFGGSLEHTHNSWLEVLFRLGLPGLIVSLIVTAVAVWNAVCLLLRNQDMWKTCIALLVLCMLASGVLEPFFFIANASCHFLDFLLLLLTGYMTQWRKAPGSDVANP